VDSGWILQNAPITQRGSPRNSWIDDHGSLRLLSHSDVRCQVTDTSATTETLPPCPWSKLRVPCPAAKPIPSNKAAQMAWRQVERKSKVDDGKGNAVTGPARSDFSLAHKISFECSVGVALVSSLGVARAFFPTARHTWLRISSVSCSST
jgi:hypothetical protein